MHVCASHISPRHRFVDEAHSGLGVCGLEWRGVPHDALAVVAQHRGGVAKPLRIEEGRALGCAHVPFFVVVVMLAL
jgi:hypothetical protein